MKATSRPRLPLAPLLGAYLDAGPPSAAELARLPGWGPRFGAILDARRGLLSETTLDGAAAGDFEAALVRFYADCVPPGLHTDALRRRAGVVRHALGHLLRGRDPLPTKLARCLASQGPYFVAGLGPAFWSALAQALDPLRHPAWTPTTLAGLHRLRLLRRRAAEPARIYADLLDACARIQRQAPRLTALHVDHFLALVAGMRGRELIAGPLLGPLLPFEAAPPVAMPRGAEKERRRALARARRALEVGLVLRAPSQLAEIFAAVDPAGSRASPIDWPRDAEAAALWVARLWDADDPLEALDAFWRADPVPGAGLWFPVAVLHLKDAARYPLWDAAARRGHALHADSPEDGIAPAERYRLYCEAAQRIEDSRQKVVGRSARSGVPFDNGDIAAKSLPTTHGLLSTFHGFCGDTFRFLAELGKNNRRDWMQRQRGRYRFVVREPLVELCRALAERYIEPVLARQWGWELETAPRSGRALTSVVKNDYGRTAPYQTALWITFYPRGSEGRRGVAAQFFVRLDAAGLSYGVCLGRHARAAAARFRGNVAEHAEVLFRALHAGGALEECRFGTVDALDDTAAPARKALAFGFRPGGPDDLRVWVGAKEGRRAAAGSLAAAKVVPADADLLRCDDLVGDVLLTFERLLPLFACATADDPRPTLERRAGTANSSSDGGEAEFLRATYLSEDWLRRARSLLDLKRQLILQGVPGTGKTHVARRLAALLTGGDESAIRLVQFHPAYSYEEFVEGIKVRSVEVAGRHDVTYPIEDGLLCAFAAEAARRPTQAHVLLIDEINRGNLPRVFGELLYLLEYREQSVQLPYSKRGFQLPANLILLGTMNLADRSVALVDQALRRRFSFLEMPPDAAVLRSWLHAHPPAAGPEFAERVAALFERLNAKLRADLGPAAQVGHSYFMVPSLDEVRLRVVWEHHLRPLLEEHFADPSSKRAAYSFDALFRGAAERPSRRRQRLGASE